MWVGAATKVTSAIHPQLLVVNTRLFVRDLYGTLPLRSLKLCSNNSLEGRCLT
jgi:hypothetical protein